MKKKLLKEGDFFKFVPQFMLDQAVEDCLKSWKESEKVRYKRTQFAESLSEKIREHIVGFIENGLQAPTPAKTEEVKLHANNVVITIKNEAFVIISQENKDKAHLSQELKQMVNDHILFFTRMI